MELKIFGYKIFIGFNFEIRKISKQEKSDSEFVRSIEYINWVNNIEDNRTEQEVYNEWMEKNDRKTNK